MGVTYLLDTHVLLWLLAGSNRVDEAVRRRLADRSHRLLVSAASALEIAAKVRLGKLAFPGVSTLADRVVEIGAELLAITFENAALAGSLQWEHRDPFDRLLVAQAIQQHAVLVTVDRRLVQLPTVTVLTW